MVIESDMMPLTAAICIHYTVDSRLSRSIAIKFSPIVFALLAPTALTLPSELMAMTASLTEVKY